MRIKVFLQVLMLTVCVSSFSSIFAQEKKVTGVVSDEKGTPLAGATVTAKGVKTSVTTDANGKFSIVAPAAAKTLEISFVGMATQEIAIGKQSSFTVTLRSVNTAMDEVVVIGYGKMKKTDLSSAQTSINSAEINKTVNTTMDQAIQGRAAGVYVTQNSGQPGGGLSVNIRGVSTLTGTTQPLYVIDGVQIQPGAVGYGNTASANPLAGINPSDIESMEILQGPSATAIYGTRATNGVILITTKRGKKNQKAKFSYAYLRALQDKPKTQPVLNFIEYAQLTKDLYTASGQSGNLPEQYKDPSSLGEGTNWQNAMFKQSLLDKHQVSISGGLKNTNYYISGEYFKQDGVAIGSSFERLSSRLNIDQQIVKNVKAGFSASIASTKEELTSTSEDVIRTAINTYPGLLVKNADGTWGGVSTGDGFGGNIQYVPNNPIAMASLVKNKQNNLTLMGDVYVEAKLWPGLTLRISANGNKSKPEAGKLTPIHNLSPSGNLEEKIDSTYTENSYWNVGQLLQYYKAIKKHNIGVTLGHEAQTWSWESHSDNINITAPAKTNRGLLSKSEGALESYFSRINYTYNNKYILQLAGRYDGGSAFGENNRRAFFPSMSAAWRITEEPFFRKMTGLKFFNDVKLRVEYGSTGNMGSDGYAQYTIYKQQIGSLGDTIYVPEKVGNPDIKWEKTITKNIGLTLAMLNNRIQVDVDFFNKETNGLIMTLPVDVSLTGTGAPGALTAPTVNVGSLRNNGFNFSINSVNIDNRAKHFKWTSNFNISTFNTKIQALSYKPFLESGIWWLNNFKSRSTVGGAPWMFYGYVAEKLFTSIDEINTSARPDITTQANVNGTWVGDVKYKDLNGDGVIDGNDQTQIGNPWPKFTFGFSNTFSYKDFDLSILVIGSQGNEIYNYMRYLNANATAVRLGRNVYREALGYAVPENKTGTNEYYLQNPNTQVSRLTIGDPNGNYNRFTQWYVEDGSFVKIKNITLGYSLPENMIKKIKLIKGARISLGIQNLATFTKYSGYDPEIGQYVGKEVAGDRTYQGLDAGRYPLTRVYNLNFGIDF